MTCPSCQNNIAVIPAEEVVWQMRGLRKGISEMKEMTEYHMRQKKETERCFKMKCGTQLHCFFANFKDEKVTE